MDNRTETVARLAGTRTVARAVATLHVDASATECLTAAFSRVANVDTAAARDVFYFAAACLTAHGFRRAVYSVAVRRAVCA